MKPADETARPDPARGHANQHVASFLSLPEHDLAVDNSSSTSIQVVHNGKTLTVETLLKNDDSLTLSRPILVRDTPESIGMKVLKYPNRQVTVADIAAIIGESYPIHVIDVEYQEELEGWTLGDLVDYFEDEERLLYQQQQQPKEGAMRTDTTTTCPKPAGKKRRKAAEKALQKAITRRPRVLNQISLEFSKTPLRSRIQSPKFVRDMDWIDNAWPKPRADEQYPNVQYYCLTSASGSYTDFHVDFGGTSVWYHVLSGEKCFCLIPPSKENLALYEEWMCRPDQATTFLPDLIPNPKDVIRVSLRASQTLIIPTAWIHAVYTPSDSVVMGGNFLHGMEMKKQLEVYGIESRTKVREKFRFPFFLALHFYAGGMYLEKLRCGEVCQQEVDGIQELVQALGTWWNVYKEQTEVQSSGPTIFSAANEVAKRNSCLTVDDFLGELRREHSRVVEQGISPNKDYTPPRTPAKPKLKLKLKPIDAMPKEAPPKEESEPDTTTSNTTTTTEPRLRLKLKGGRSPKSSENNKKDNFRIVVSSAKVTTPTVPAQKPPSKRVKEDTEWIDEGIVVDDDWMPSKKSKQRKTNAGNSTTSSARGKSSKMQPKPTSARQRLMKRFR
eukprot:scaffold8740_cov113-Cylindrotheca_fusiformis.AAC.6